MVGGVGGQGQESGLSQNPSCSLVGEKGAQVSVQPFLISVLGSC